jgi:Tat protein translocase TatB subunit
MAMLLFFDIGTGELILILLIVFVVMGPKKLPEVARTMGKTINELKRASAGFKNEINKEVQRLDRETRFNDFLQQKAVQNESVVNEGETVSTKAAPKPNEITEPEPDQETGRIERKG